MPLVPTPKQCDPSVKKAIQILTQKLGLKSTPTFAGLILNGTKPYGIDVSGGTWSSAALNLDANPTIQANGTIIFQSNPSGGYQGRSTESLFLGSGTRNGDGGSWDVFIGYHAGYNNNTDNVTVGVDGTSNIYIGARAGAGEVLLTGTITATNSSDAVVGSGTLFDSELVVGDVIRIKELRGAYEVATITDDTHLTFTTDYTGTTGSGLPSYRERGDNYGNECIAVGHLALCLNTTGYENTAVGDNALKMNTTGHGNIALGNDALQGKEDTVITGSYNTGIGTDSLYVVSSGGYNTAIGYKTLYENTTGGYNFAAGFQALSKNTTASYNFAIGFRALYNTTTAQYDVAIGYEAGYNDNGDPTVGENVFIGHQSFYNDNGRYNIGLGYHAGYNNDSSGGGNTGTKNVYIGYQAGLGAAAGNTGYWNVGIGQASLDALTSGYGNVAIGVSSGTKITSGILNVAIGGGSLFNCTTSYNNMAIGGNALYYTTGTRNVGIGYLAFYRNASGVSNVGIGDSAGKWNQGGDYNTIIGAQAGSVGNFSVNDFSDNTFIGYQSAYLITTASHCAFIGYKSGYNQVDTDDLLIIDNQDRGSAAAEITNCLIYGVFDAVVANQTLRINAQTEVHGLVIQVVAKTGAYTLTAIDDFIECDASGGAFTITLPAVASTTTGKVYHIKKIDSSANVVTVDGNASETIDDGTTASITTQYECITIINNGSEWWII